MPRPEERDHLPTPARDHRPAEARDNRAGRDHVEVKDEKGTTPGRARLLAVGAVLLAAGLLSLVLCTRFDDDPPVAIPSSVAPIGEGAEELASYGGQLTVRDLIMDARGGGEISGYIVRPKRLTRPTAAVVLLHGRGTDANDLVIEGVLLARLGAIAIVPDNAYVRLGPVDKRGLGGMRQDRRRRLASAQDLADLVVALKDDPRVDQDRIAVAGYSLGGYIESLVAGHLPLAAEVYVATGAEWIQDRPLTEDADAQAMAAELDPVAAIDQAPDRRARPRLIQFGIRDDVIRADRLRRFAAAAGAPKRVIRYDAGHMLDVKAVTDRLAWLSRELGLRPG